MSAVLYWTEARQSWRALARKPGYLLLAMLTLALGVATTTTVFALLDQALLKPLPFPQPQQLVTLGQADGGSNVAAPGYYPVLRQMAGIQAIGIARGFPVPTNIARGGTSEVVQAISADAGFLHTLGLPMATGRNFNAEESRPGGPQAVILGYRFWLRYFGGDPATVGRTLQVEGVPVQIVGVLPADFPWAQPFDLIRNMQPDLATTNLSTNEVIIARLRPGVSVEAASAQTAVVIKRLLRNNPHMDDAWWQSLQRQPPNALPLQDSLYTSYSGNTLWLFFAAACCVLSIAAINLTSLMLLRALGRGHDSAVRAALGAPWMRLNLPALAEGVLIGALGSLAGLALAWLGLRLLGGWVPLLWMRGEPAHLTGSSALFALFAGGATALLAAALGIVRGRRRNLVAEL
ncbi:ABC transporter permease, partial [Xanthomonas maliensis]